MAVPSAHFPLPRPGSPLHALMQGDQAMEAALLQLQEAYRLVKEEVNVMEVNLHPRNLYVEEREAEEVWQALLQLWNELHFGIRDLERRAKRLESGSSALSPGRLLVKTDQP